MMLWIEGLVALIITSVFFGASFFIFKPEHVAHHPWRVRIGAALQGLVIGLVIGFVIVPLRFAMMQFESGPPTEELGWLSLSILPVVVLLILIRRGALLRAPILSPYLRAYRRAMLLRTRDETQKQLTKLDEIEGRGAPA